jgi:hypothetical protein
MKIIFTVLSFLNYWKQTQVSVQDTDNKQRQQAGWQNSTFLFMIRTDENCSFYTILQSMHYSLLPLTQHEVLMTSDESENGYWLIKTNKSPSVQK